MSPARGLPRSAHLAGLSAAGKKLKEAAANEGWSPFGDIVLLGRESATTGMQPVVSTGAGEHLADEATTLQPAHRRCSLIPARLLARCH